MKSKTIFRIDLIENFIEKKHWSKVQFCVACGVSPVELDKILSGDEDLFVACAGRISKCLGVKVENLFEDLK